MNIKINDLLFVQILKVILGIFQFIEHFWKTKITFYTTVWVYNFIIAQTTIYGPNVFEIFLKG